MTIRAVAVSTVISVAVLACTLGREAQPAHEPIVDELVALLEERPDLP